MRNLLAGVVLAVASAGSWAQTAFSFSLYSSLSDSTVGSGSYFFSTTDRSWQYSVSYNGFQPFVLRQSANTAPLYDTLGRPVGFQSALFGSEEDSSSFPNYYYSETFRTGSGGSPVSYTFSGYITNRGQTVTANDRGTVLFAAPIPEPETWALLAAGLGLMALQRRHRSFTPAPGGRTSGG